MKRGHLKGQSGGFSGIQRLGSTLQPTLRLIYKANGNMALILSTFLLSRELKVLSSTHIDTALYLYLSTF